MISSWRRVSHEDEAALPYFTDLHLNGAGDVDLLHAKSVDEIHQLGQALFSQGTVAYQPSLISAPRQQTLHAISLVESARRERRDDEAEILGIHLEGPFLAPEMAGAHPKEFLLEPSREVVSRYLSAGTITMVTLAPELPGAIELISFLTAMGVRVSIGHSNAKRKVAQEAFRAGASAVTHIYNRSSSELVEVALEESDATLMAIADGSHLSDDRIVDLFHRASDRIVATTDSVSTRGLGSHEVEIRDGVAFRSDGTKAGSTATMRRLWEKISALVDPENATAACASRPAAFMGRPELATLEFGYPAQRSFTT